MPPSEATLSPTEIVCRWLDEAHAFDELDAYIAWLIDQPDERHVLASSCVATHVTIPSIEEFV